MLGGSTPGPLKLDAQTTAMRELDRVVLTPLPDTDAVAKRFLAIRKALAGTGRSSGFPPGLREHVCSGWSAAIGGGYAVARALCSKGRCAIIPNPEVEKDNVNYLAGVREIAVHSEYTDGRDMPRLLIRSVEFEGPYYDTWPAPQYKNIFVDSGHKNDPAAYARGHCGIIRDARISPPGYECGSRFADGGVSRVGHDRDANFRTA